MINFFQPIGLDRKKKKIEKFWYFALGAVLEI